MCDACSRKLLELDAKIPHFIDRYDGMMSADSPRSPKDDVFQPGLEELWKVMKGKHGKVILLQ
jgi:hypothetical protein